MPLTEAQKSCQNRYYQKNSEKIKERMREYAKKRRETGVEAEARRDYYYTTQDNKKKEYIKRYLDDDGITDTFKSFLRSCVEPQLENIPLRFFREFDNLAIVRPTNNSV
jgi:hypothetical protein